MVPKLDIPRIGGNCFALSIAGGLIRILFPPEPGVLKSLIL